MSGDIFTGGTPIKFL